MRWRTGRHWDSDHTVLGSPDHAPTLVAVLRALGEVASIMTVLVVVHGGS
ncbi:hypothetical protein [Ruegeria sp. EL01]|nr:hypothetical protein [Ruegeria sp. EL01]